MEIFTISCITLICSTSCHTQYKSLIRLPDTEIWKENQKAKVIFLAQMVLPITLYMLFDFMKESLFITIHISFPFSIYLTLLVGSILNLAIIRGKRKEGHKAQSHMGVLTLHVGPTYLYDGRLCVGVLPTHTLLGHPCE